MDRETANRVRYQSGSRAGHYESYFQRANHPSRPLAFWIRYTIFSPTNRPHDALGELWAIYFDGESEQITAVKQRFPITQCRFGYEGLDAEIGAATLDRECLIGGAESAVHWVRWNLTYQGNEPPLLLLDRKLYDGGFPRAKALVGTPLAVYNGSLNVDGTDIAVDGWVGSQNHNWGSKHTDLYAWGQVAGFDDAPNVFLECSTARLKIGPVWTPYLTLVVVRMGGEEIALNTLAQSLRAKGKFKYFAWDFESKRGDVRIAGHIEAPRSRFVGLTYDNPPGGSKTCLNTKIAACTLTVERAGHPPRTFRTEHRAAFEILTDATDHNVPVVA